MKPFSWPTLTAGAIRWPYQTRWITYQKALAANHSSAIDLASRHARDHRYEDTGSRRHIVGSDLKQNAVHVEAKPRRCFRYDQLFEDLVSYCDETDQQTSIDDPLSWTFDVGSHFYQLNRLCMGCIRHGYQSPIHWNRLLSTCPLCDGELRDNCPKCGTLFSINRNYSSRYICQHCKWRFPAYRDLCSSAPSRGIAGYHERFLRFVGRCNDVLVTMHHEPLADAIWSENHVELSANDCRLALARVAAMTGHGSFARSLFGVTPADQSTNANIERVAARWSNAVDVTAGGKHWSLAEEQLLTRLRSRNPRCALIEIAGDSRTLFPCNDHCAACRAIIFCRTRLTAEPQGFNLSRRLYRDRSIRIFIDEYGSIPGRFILGSRQRKMGNFVVSADAIIKDETYAYFIFALATYKWACWRLVRAESAFYQDIKQLVLNPLRKIGLLPFRAPVFFRTNTPLEFDVLRQYPDPQNFALRELDDTDCIPPVFQSDRTRTLTLFSAHHMDAPVSTRYSGTQDESPDYLTLPGIEWFRHS